MWGYLKSKVYSNRPTDLHALKENIREEIAKLSEETLVHARDNFLNTIFAELILFIFDLLNLIYVINLSLFLHFH